MVDFTMKQETELRKYFDAAIANLRDGKSAMIIVNSPTENEKSGINFFGNITVESTFQNLISLDEMIKAIVSNTSTETCGCNCDCMKEK